MTPKQVYEELHGDYNAIFAAVRSDAVIARLLKMLQKDESMKNLAQGIAESDPETAFRAAHTLKGVSLNLHLDELSKKAIELTEILRPRVLVGYQDAYRALVEEFQRTERAIEQLD